MTGSHNIKVGFQRTWGTFFHTTDSNADLYQIYASGINNGGTGVPWHAPGEVLVRNTPVRSGEALNYDLGIFAQDSWTIKRLTVNVGLRWEHAERERARGLLAGRTVRAGAPLRGGRGSPEWKDWAPRFALVYDLFGNAKTALKYSLNRYNLSTTTGIADNYNPLDSSTADASVDRPEQRRRRAGRKPGGERHAGELRVPDAGMRDQLPRT